MEKKNLIPLAMMFALFFMISFVTGLQNPMAIIVKSQFAISNLLSQLGNAATFIAYLFMGVPAGLMLRRIGYRHTIQIAAFIGLIGMGTTYLASPTGSFGVYLAGAFISGFSMCLLNVAANPMVNTLGGGGKRGNQLLQTAGLFNSTGATVAPILVGLLMGNTVSPQISDAIPAIVLAGVIFLLAFIVFSLVRIPEPHQASQRTKSVSPLRYRHFVMGIIAIFIYVGIEVGIPNIANLYMTSPVEQNGLGIATETAGAMVGLYWILMLAGRFIGASLGTKLSSKTMLLGVSSLAIILTIAAILVPPVIINIPHISQVPLNIMLLTLIGLCTSVMWGNIFNLAVEGLGDATETASGLFMTMVCGGGVMPLIQAFLADHIGYINSYAIIIIGLIYLVYYSISGHKHLLKDNQ